MVAGDWQPHVPAATIGRPRIVEGVIRRPRITELLDGRAGDPVVVCAPAGYGKTVAVALWDEADERPFAWVRIDHLDDDPVHLLLHIATAVDQVCPIDRAVLRYLRGPGREPLTELIPQLIQAVEACGPLVIVLDDVHELTAQDAVAVLRELVDAVPDTTTLVLIGRGPMPLDLARRRLQHRVVDIGSAPLRYSSAEAAAVLDKAGGLSDPANVALVMDQCEGWPAGVTLAAMVVRDGGAVDSFTARHNLIADYFVEEVLRQLDEKMGTFLVESAVLERFNADQLDAVLERDDSAQILERLRLSGNPFLIALDEQRVWYRYHRLFGDLLRDQLRRRDGARFRELARRAARRLDLEGDVDGALPLALAGRVRAHAAELVGREAVRLGFDGRAGVLGRRLALLDEQTFAQYPDAAVARAWLGVTTADAELIQRSLVLAARADGGRPLADGTPSVKVAAALVSSLVGVGGVHSVIRHAELVRAAGDHLVNPWWGAATVMLGAAESMLGNTSRARTLLEAAVPVTVDLPGFQAAALAHMALLDLGAGDDTGAIASAAAARRIADEYDLCDVVPMVVVYATSAVLAARVGDEAAAREAVEITERLLHRLGYLAARTALLGHGLLAWTAAVLGDNALMQKHLEVAERMRRREPEAVALAQRVDRVRAMMATHAGPLTAAELRLLPYLATHLSLQRIADELTIGRETAKTQATSIYRKLAVSSRAAAVAEAKRVGLLTD